MSDEQEWNDAEQPASDGEQNLGVLALPSLVFGPWLLVLAAPGIVTAQTGDVSPYYAIGVVTVVIAGVAIVFAGGVLAGLEWGGDDAA